MGGCSGFHCCQQNSHKCPRRSSVYSMINICVYFCEVFHSQVWTERGSLDSPRPQSSALRLKITFFFLMQKVSSTVQEKSVQHLQGFNIRIHIQYALTCVWMTFLVSPCFLSFFALGYTKCLQGWKTEGISTNWTKVDHFWSSAHSFIIILHSLQEWERSRREILNLWF